MRKARLLSNTCWALPDFKLLEVERKPMPAQGAAPAEAGATPAAAGEGDADAEDAENLYHFKFWGSESLHFFWGVDRMTA